MPEIEQNAELTAWLAIATEGLCAPAKVRIEAEIRAHYAEAVAAQLAEGACEEEAHRATMASLGEPGRAWRAFRKAYLTEGEAKSLLPARAQTSWLRLYAAALLLFSFSLLAHACLMYVRDGMPRNGEAGGVAPLLSGVLLATFMRQFLLPRLARQKRWRRILHWHLVFGVLLFVAVIGIFLDPLYECTYFSAIQLLTSTAILIILLPLLMTWRLFRILRKLGKHVELYDALFSNTEGGRHA